MSCRKVRAPKAQGRTASLRLFESWIRTQPTIHRCGNPDTVRTPPGWRMTSARGQVHTDSPARSITRGSEVRPSRGGPGAANKRPGGWPAELRASPPLASLPSRRPAGPMRVLTRNRGPHSPSPTGVRRAPAAFMPRTVGREAPSSARAQHQGARTAHC